MFPNKTVKLHSLPSPKLRGPQMEMRSLPAWSSCGRQGGVGTVAFSVFSILTDRVEAEGTTLSSGPLAPKVLSLIRCRTGHLCPGRAECTAELRLEKDWLQDTVVF